MTGISRLLSMSDSIFSIFDFELTDDFVFLCRGSVLSSVDDHCGRHVSEPSAGRPLTAVKLSLIAVVVQLESSQLGWNYINQS